MTYEQLEKDVILLQESMNILQELVHEQQDPIDNLEQFIHDSKEKVKEGTELIETTSYSYFIYAGGVAITIFYLILL